MYYNINLSPAGQTTFPLPVPCRTARAPSSLPCFCSYSRAAPRLWVTSLGLLLFCLLFPVHKALFPAPLRVVPRLQITSFCFLMRCLLLSAYRSLLSAPVHAPAPCSFVVALVPAPVIYIYTLFNYQ